MTTSTQQFMPKVVMTSHNVVQALIEHYTMLINVIHEERIRERALFESQLMEEKSKVKRLEEYVEALDKEKRLK
jgi:hypothetical protein